MTGKREWSAVKTAKHTPKLKHDGKNKGPCPSCKSPQHTAKNITDSITVAVPVFKHQTMKMYWTVEVQFLAFLN